MQDNSIEDELWRQDQNRHFRTTGSGRIHHGNICAQGAERDFQLWVDGRQQFRGAQSRRSLWSTKNIVKRDGLMRGRRIAVFLDQRNKKQVGLHRTHGVIEKVHQLPSSDADDFVYIGRHFNGRDEFPAIVQLI